MDIGYQFFKMERVLDICPQQYELLNTIELKNGEGKFYVLCILPQFQKVGMSCVNVL